MARNRSMNNWSWLKANDVFRRCRDKYDGAAVAKNSRIKLWGTDANGENIYCGTYCGTALVKWYPSGRVDVTTSGWDTLTTKRRLYQFARVSVETIKGHRIIRDTSCGSRTAVVDNDAWFTLRMSESDCGLRPVDGVVTPGVITKMRKPSTSKRNPLSKLCRGDVLVSPEGKHFIADVGTKTYLVPYFGDPAPGLVRVSWEGEEMEVSPMLELALRSGGWKAGKRFASAA